METKQTRKKGKKEQKYEPVQKLLEDIADEYVNCMHDCRNTNLSALLDQKFS